MHSLCNKVGELSHACYILLPVAHAALVEHFIVIRPRLLTSTAGQIRYFVPQPVAPLHLTRTLQLHADAHGGWCGRNQTYLENLLQHRLQTAKRRAQDFSISNVCLNCLCVHTLRVYADKVDAFAGKIVLRDERQLILSVWLVR